jgi:hypothetical protein
MKKQKDLLKNMKTKRKTVTVTGISEFRNFDQGYRYIKRSTSATKGKPNSLFHHFLHFLPASVEKP